MGVVVIMWKTACLLVLTGLLVTSGSLSAQNAGTVGLQPDGPIVRDPNYRLAPDDVLQLTVWGEPAIQGVYLTVTPEGVIVAPVVGSIRAAGRTVEEVKAEIARRFIEMDYLKNPTVQLTLYQVHRMRVRVLGQVYRPGLQQMRDGDTVAHAIAEAGSFIPDTAALSKATITRPGQSEPIPVNLEAFYFEGDMSQDLPLKDGDTIYIPEDTESKIYVMGMVQRPGQFPWKKTTTVTQAISQAGGPLERGALGRTVIVRRAAEGQEPQQIPVNVADSGPGRHVEGHPAAAGRRRSGAGDQAAEPDDHQSGALEHISGGLHREVGTLTGYDAAGRPEDGVTFRPRQ
jgi:polysaccharide export outer membrane protein